MARESSGVKDQNIEITDDALLNLIKSYCRESGVRNLQKHIEKVCTEKVGFLLLLVQQVWLKFFSIGID
jgi:ATP-dependent Lon protease